MYLYMTKKQLLENLTNDIYCKIGVSKVHGVGVIAIKNIPKNTNPFKISDNKCVTYDCIKITQTELQTVPMTSRILVKAFIAKEPDGSFCVPASGLNNLNISFYLNHSDNNNVDVNYHTKCDFLDFITNRNIKRGEELFINYDELN